MTSIDSQPDRNTQVNRRALMAAAAGAALLGGHPARGAAARSAPGASPFILGLNTSTIRGRKLGIVEIVDVAARAGYQGLEPWMDEIKRYQDGGGSLGDLGKRFRDAGLSIESVIDFFEWSVDDPERRRKGLENARRSLEVLQKLGAKRVAAPASGATDKPVELPRLAERYRALLELGDEFGIVPEVEVWGHSKTLGNLAEAAYVAIAANHPRACLLPDVYHLHRGGSDFEGLKLLGPGSIAVLHMNDYPDAPDRTKLTDADRVFPGDGVAPITSILETLATGGFRVMLSLELFNRKLWQEDPAVVAATGFQKMKALVDALPAPAPAPAGF